jgi:SAM-dependent methyltransferase
MKPEENLSHWNDSCVESMYDKNLLRLETENLKQWIPEGSYICDVGCGEGEATLEYSQIPGVEILAVDNSPTRLHLAEDRLAGQVNVELLCYSVLDDFTDERFDVVISQRLLVNLPSWKKQKKALKRLIKLLKPGGRLLLSEGSINGATALNDFRFQMGLPDIPVPEHNVFIDDEELTDFAWEKGLVLLDEDSLGAYYFLTRGVQPALTCDFRWDSEFNKLSAGANVCDLERFSRIKQWCFQK